MKLTAMPSRARRVSRSTVVGMLEIDNPITINEIGHCLWPTMAGLFANTMNVRDELLPIDSNKRSGTAVQGGDDLPWVVPSPNIWTVTGGSPSLRT